MKNTVIIGLVVGASVVGAGGVSYAAMHGSDKKAEDASMQMKADEDAKMLQAEGESKYQIDTDAMMEDEKTNTTPDAMEKTDDAMESTDVMAPAN